MDNNHYHDKNIQESTRKTCLNVDNIVNKKHNQPQQGYSFKLEHIIDFTFSSDNKENKDLQTQQYSKRLFLGNHVSYFIKSHFQKKYHSRHYLHRHNPSGAISLPDDLYQEMTSLQCQILNLLQYEYIDKNKIMDIHIAYLQKIHCLGIIVYYQQDAYDDNTKLSLPIFNKYFNVIGFIDHKCNKYWECPSAKCRYQLNKISDMDDVIFFCEKCKNDFTFQHNPNNRYYHQSFNNVHTVNKKIRSCIKYRFLSLAQLENKNNHKNKINHVYNKKNLFTKNLFHEMSHEEFKALSATQSRNKDIETEKSAKSKINKTNKNANNHKIDWIDKLMLNNVEKWFDHKPGTKIGLNDYHFGDHQEDQILDGVHNVFVRCRDSEGERHGVDHECVSCRPHLASGGLHHGNSHYDDSCHSEKRQKTWLCSLCQKTIPIDIKTCICISSESTNHNEYKSNKDKDCLIVIKELAETLHSTISFNEIPQEFKTSSKPFEYEVCFNGEIVAKGHGNSKRKAQRNGAEIALEKLSSRGDEIKRKITLLKQFDRIGHYEIDPNLFVEVCIDISDQQHLYCIIYNNYMLNARCMRPVIIDETPDIIAYKTRVFEISRLEEPSVLGYLNARGPSKFSLVCGIFHKDVNNGRYGYNFREKRDKKKRKSNKRRRKSNKHKKTMPATAKTAAVVLDAAISTMSINEVNNEKTEGGTVKKWIGLQRNKNTYSHPSKYVDHQIYSRENSPIQHTQSKRRRSRRLSQKQGGIGNQMMDGVYICCECGKYFADNSNGRYLSQLDSKWFCFACLKKMKDAYLTPFIECSVYTDRKNAENKDKETVTPPMTPPSSDDENNTHNIANIAAPPAKLVIDEGDIVFDENGNKETTNVSLFGPHTPRTPRSPVENEEEPVENDDNRDKVQNAAGDETESDSKSAAKEVETVSTATQCNENKAVHEQKNKENESTSSTSTPSPPLCDPHVQNGTITCDDLESRDSDKTYPKMYPRNKRKFGSKYNKDKFHPNNGPMNHHQHNGYHHHPRHHPHHHHHYAHSSPSPPNVPPHIPHHGNMIHHNNEAPPPHILYGPPYNLHNGWNAYYGNQHGNMMFLDNLHSPIHHHHHHHAHSHPLHAQCRRHHYRYDDDTQHHRDHASPPEPQTVPNNRYKTFECTNYSNI